MKLVKPLVFIHVEKAGGITLHNMFHYHIDGYISPSPRFGPYFTVDTFNSIKKYIFPRPSSIGGHRLHPEYNYFPDQFLFSIVRNPIDRLISHYNWHISKKKYQKSFDDFISEPYFKNFQSFRLTGSRDYHKAISIINDRYGFIGIFEDYDSSISILSNQIFNDPSYLKYEKANVTPGREKAISRADLSEDYIQKITQYNATDMATYQYIKEVFYSTYHKTGLSTIKDHLKLNEWDHIRRKLSNKYLAYFLQPLYETKVKPGY
ncbi:sulfotransferase family 2 domain-containing protein [Portibacter marinus]|uniref:sulfotransferase family 2 domain-containing protein n=1 Tax=Portibacter marinus TaxID=2898660 RepID=UPI001F3F0B21|nr:sulfotransferase family 2 domain-containing protein [Portibacter marinus]